MTRQAVFLATAQADIRGIIRSVTERSGSTDVARAVAARLRARCHRLAALPGTLGRARADLAPNLRSVPEGSYVILFRYAAADRLEVVRILHGSRDLAAVLRPPPG